jgi:hypothetical protein
MHRFIVIQISTPCDGIIRIDLLKALGTVIDPKTTSIRIEAVTFALERAKSRAASCTEMHVEAPVLECQPVNETAMRHKEGRSLEYRQLLSEGSPEMRKVLSATTVAPARSVKLTTAEIVTENQDKILKLEN